MRVNLMSERRESAAFISVQIFRIKMYEKISVFDNAIKNTSPEGEQTGCGIHWLLMAQGPVLQEKCLHRTAALGEETAFPNEEVQTLVGGSEDYLCK